MPQNQSPTLGSTSCLFFKGAVIGLAIMGYNLLLKQITQPSGTGDMTGMNHLGYNMAIGLMMIVGPGLALIGFVTGLFGLKNSRSQAAWGASLNGLILLLAVYAWYLSMPPYYASRR